MRALPQPTLVDDGLTIRPWHPDDAVTVFDAYQDPAIRHWHVKSMSGPDEAAQWIEARAHQWEREVGADWAIADDAFLVGRVSIGKLDLHEGLGDIAYWVLPRARGRGLAFRAVRAVTTWAFEVLSLHRLELVHSTANLASCRTATKAGYDLEGTKRQHLRHPDGWHDMHLHARIAEI